MTLADALLENLPTRGRVLRAVPPEIVDAAVGAVLVAGPRIVHDSGAIVILEGANDRPRAEGLERVLNECDTLSTRQAAVSRLDRKLTRTAKLERLVRTFVWGVKTARQLTGRMFTVEMISGKELGYTRLHENRSS